MHAAVLSQRQHFLTRGWFFNESFFWRFQRQFFDPMTHPVFESPFPSLIYSIEGCPWKKPLLLLLHPANVDVSVDFMICYFLLPQKSQKWTQLKYNFYRKIFNRKVKHNCFVTHRQVLSKKKKELDRSIWNIMILKLDLKFDSDHLTHLDFTNVEFSYWGVKLNFINEVASLRVD